MKPKRKFLNRRGYFSLAAFALLTVSVFCSTAWFQSRYDDTPDQSVTLRAYSNADYPEDPEDRSTVFGNYPHWSLRIQQIGETRFRFLIEPASDRATAIELPEVDLAHFVAAVPPWVRSDRDLTRVGLIDREWNRQQVSFRSNSVYVRIHDGGDGFERRGLTRVDLARNCLNAGLWELLLFTVEDGEERLYEHTWFTFPLGLYKQLFERVNGLSYWDYWWSLEHWTDPSGTPIQLDRLRTVEQEWTVNAGARWEEHPLARGEQRFKRKNILAPPIYTYRDWYAQPVQFASFIPPGRYSVSHPRDTELHYLAEFTGAVLRQVRIPVGPQLLFELELAFKDSHTGEPNRLIFGGLDLQALPTTSPDQYERGWQVPMGIGNPSFFESYEEVLANSPRDRPYYGFHLDAQDRWIDHHAVGVDGPLLHWDADDPSKLHLYLLAYERHALLNHFVLTCPPEACPRH
ncbi:MAG: hypothetical protein HY581_01620 [Nitrospirae bacterium]|nr:hypothetical protein [Nitrospirota bacterium]